MPKRGNGIPYFDIQTDISEDKRIKLLKAEFGIKGFGIWIELLRQIYADEGYFLEWDDDTKLLFASDVGESGGLVDEVVKGSVKRGLFDESVFNQFNVLTSKHIQEKYFNAIKRRTAEIGIKGKYLVIPPDADIIPDNVNIKGLNVNKKEQSRVEKSKEDKSRIHTPPDREEVIEYFKQKGYPERLANKFYDYYNEPMEDRNGRVWKDQNGNTVKSWKQKAIAVWFKDQNKKNYGTTEKDQQGNGGRSEYERDSLEGFEHAQSTN